MAIQIRNDAMLDLLSSQFVTKTLPLMVYGDFSGYGEIPIAAIDTTTRIILSDDIYDVKAVLRYTAIVLESTGGVNTTTGQLVPGGTVNVYSSGGQTCVLRVNIDGSVDIRRTAGTSTFDVHLTLNWI